MTFTLGERIDLANIGLMVIAFAIAFVLPFETFLFAYGILGPLHYLTEIGWLHKKGYFTTGKNDYLILGIFALFITIGFLNFSSFLGSRAHSIIYVSFLAALAMVLIKNNTLKIIIIILAGFSTLIFNDATFYRVFFAIYIPTILHVFIFTAAFMLFGALKSNSKPGLIAVALLFVFSGLFFVIPAPYSSVLDPGYIQKSYGGFTELNKQLIELFGLADLHVFSEYSYNQMINTVFDSQIGFQVMRFVAFAYTYHYLNWFSKTSVIQWHKVSKITLVGVLIIWATSVGLYMYDYMIGLKWLFLLSFLHVLLEFPLNHKSFLGIAQEIKQRISLKKSTA